MCPKEMKLIKIKCISFFQSGVLKFCGPTKFASGIWAGIELDETAGKNDGSVSGVRYFTCQQKHGTVLIK